MRLFFKILFLVLILVFGAMIFFDWQRIHREVEDPTFTAPTTGHFVKAYDLNVFVQEAGPIHGQPLVLIHGTGSWGQIWQDTIRPLNDAGYRTIAIDLPPFGYSDKPEGEQSYSREVQAKRLIGILDALHIQKAIFVAHSVGSRPTIEAALEAPERVMALILVAPALGFPTTPEQGFQFKQNDPSWLVKSIFGIRPLRNFILSTYGTNPLFIKRIFSSFVYNTDMITESRVDIIKQPMGSRNTTNAYGDWLSYLVLSQDTSEASNFNTFHKLLMPVSLIWGDKDTVTPVWQGNALRKLIPGASLDVIPGVGHMSYIEDVKIFNSTLLRLLAKIK